VKTIADFKRAMQPGSRWLGVHEYIGNHPSEPRSLGIRECVHSNTANFGFRTPKDSISYMDWPKKAEFAANGNTVTITNDFARLTYTLQD